MPCGGATLAEVSSWNLVQGTSTREKRKMKEIKKIIQNPSSPSAETPKFPTSFPFVKSYLLSVLEQWN